METTTGIGCFLSGFDCLVARKCSSHIDSNIKYFKIFPGYVPREQTIDFAKMGTPNQLIQFNILLQSQM